MATKHRRKARIVALQALYELEVGRIPIDVVLKQVLEEAALEPELEAFAKELITGVREHQDRIDDKLASVVTEWDFDRVAAVDRNILRVAAYEIYYCPTIPPAVTLDEAIEIGKRYSTAESGKFINGVLGRVLKDSEKATWTPPAEAEIVEEIAPPEPEPEPEVETIDADSEEGKKLARVVGGWKLRSEGEES